MQPFGENMYLKGWLISDFLDPPTVPCNSNTPVERDTCPLGGFSSPKLGMPAFIQSIALTVVLNITVAASPGQPCEPTGQAAESCTIWNTGAGPQSF